MGSGSMQVSSYKTKHGYYLAKDYDANYGGEFRFLIAPLIGNDNKVFFYVRELPGGKYEVTGEAYVITDLDRLRAHKANAISLRNKKKLYYYHVDQDFNVLRKELDEAMKFELMKMSEAERKLIFRFEDGESCKAHLIGNVRGDFGRNGDEFYSSWFPEDDNKNTPQFKRDLADVIDFFRENEECPALRNYRDMASVCRNHPEWKIRHSYDNDNYAARVETENFVFYIRFIVRLNDYNFYVFGYEAAVKGLVEKTESDEMERKDENEQN